MPVRFVRGDLFANRFSTEAFAHGCNCEGSMGAGIAVGFKERYPEMYAEYRKRCKTNPPGFVLGSAFFWREAGKPAVFNLATQEKGWHGRASYPAIESALVAMLEIAEAQGVKSIAMPRIGAGFGKLSWTKVRAIIERAFANWPGELIVYEEFVPEGSPSAE